VRTLWTPQSLVTARSDMTTFACAGIAVCLRRRRRLDASAERPCDWCVRQGRFTLPWWEWQGRHGLQAPARWEVPAGTARAGVAGFSSWWRCTVGGRTASSRGDAYPPPPTRPQHQGLLAADHGPLASTGPAYHTSRHRSRTRLRRSHHRQIAVVPRIACLGERPSPKRRRCWVRSCLTRRRRTGCRLPPGLEGAGYVEHSAGAARSWVRRKRAPRCWHRPPGSPPGRQRPACHRRRCRRGAGGAAPTSCAAPTTGSPRRRPNSAHAGIWLMWRRCWPR